MTQYLLDTNTVIFYFKGVGGIAIKWAATPPSSLWLSSISLYELLVGASTSSQADRRRSDLARVLQFIQVVPFTEREAEDASEIRALLQRTGKGIGPLDTLIAATARANDMILVTHNTAEFSRIPKLRVEDWWQA